VKLDVITLPYDFESTNIATLIKMLDIALVDKKAKSVGFFLHFDKPGQLSLTSDKIVYKFSVNNNEISNFFMQIKDRLSENNSTLDFFVPLGSSG
jgi:hypothetical protein